ncbi:KICSTOR complex protein ITFG2-like [Diabrotica undecimpunctata]|uniref:KICSTOR complex protein ITFG2-like n=1 Tax=Diabrotica undecimpunctata TaxID=50387 RepID=UPI003B63DB6B
MRAISLVKRVEFEFPGNVARNAIILGDVDNDGCNELIVGNQNGDVAIFKGRERHQSISKLNFISCMAVGDITNQNKNVLIVITADGWCYLYINPVPLVGDSFQKEKDEGVEEVDGQSHSVTGNIEISPPVDVPTASKDKTNKKEKIQLVCFHVQRIPANTKDIIIGDIDGDGNFEMVLGLTDRVVRSYKWMSNPNRSMLDISDVSSQFDPSDKVLGKFVALNKWECANQIGSITLHHSADGKPSILIAQPGGTFMRIKCQSEDLIGEECIESSVHSNSGSSLGENITSSIDYQFLGISRMRNQNISTEILGDLRYSQYDSGVSFDKNSCSSQKEPSNAPTKGKPYALATLDGTIMLVQDEVILWAIAVDHQIFALTKLDVTGTGSDDIVACSWDGETYILDQDKNSVRFHLDEPVQAFQSGYYNIQPDAPDMTCLVYVTFKNSIVVYYDLPLKELICKKFEPDVVKLSELFIGDGREPEQALEYVKNMDKKTRRDLVEHLMYNN